MTSQIKLIPEESDPAQEILDVLLKTAWPYHKKKHNNSWEKSLCRLILALNPSVKKIEISEALPYGIGALNRVGFLKAMANLDYTAKTTRSKIHHIDQRLMPCLFIPESHRNAPCVVLEPGKMFYGQENNVYEIPESAQISGEIIFFQKKPESMSKYLRQGAGHSWFRVLIQRFRGTTGYIFLAGLVLNLIGLSMPIFIMLVYDHVIASHAAHILPYLAMAIFIAILAEGGVRYTRSKLQSWLGDRLDNIFSNRIFGHLLNLSPNHIESASVPSQIAKIKNFESVRDFFSGPIFTTIIELPFMVIALLVIGVIAGKLVLVPIGFSILYMLLLYAMSRKINMAVFNADKARYERQKLSLETIEKNEAIRINGLGALWSEKFHALSRHESLAQFYLFWLGSISETLANSLMILSAISIIAFGVHLTWADGLSTGALIAALLLSWQVLLPFYRLCSMLPRLEKLRNSIRQVNTLMDIDSEDAASLGLARPGRLNGDVIFNKTELRYHANDQPVFFDLSFHAKSGNIVAITGENGSGKTSLLKLIKGMYPPFTGHVRLDGFDIRQMNAHDLRRHIAYIPQNPDFFHGTIGENIRFGNPLASNRDIQQILSQAGILQDIMQLPKGLDTVIGGNGRHDMPSSLSISLSMVRAYLQDAPIILIDELPNSFLSENTGRFLHESILRNHGRQTIFIVTCHEDFLRMADIIVFLRNHSPPRTGNGKFMIQQLKQMQW